MGVAGGWHKTIAYAREGGEVDCVTPTLSTPLSVLKLWVTDESAVSVSERSAVKQSNEFESSAECLESLTKQGTTE